MKAAFQTSLGCLFIALALNVAFTQVVTDDHAWLKLYIGAETGEELQPDRIIIMTTAEPVVSHVGNKMWKIAFAAK